MESLFLPRTAQEDRRITHFTFKSYYLPKVGNFQYSGFYYIGKNTTYMEKLVNMYKRGYASEGIDNAKAELIRSLEQERNIIPEIIICEGKFDFAAIRSFTVFLKQHPALSSIPFMLDGSGLSEKRIDPLQEKYKAQTRSFSWTGCDERELKTKVEFLRKIKAGGTDAAAPRIEEAIPRHRRSGHPLKRMFDILVRFHRHSDLKSLVPVDRPGDPARIPRPRVLYFQEGGKGLPDLRFL